MRLIGDIAEISTGKVVITESIKKTVRAIEPSDIIRAFLENETVDEPLEFVKRICSATSANYPVYFFLHQAKITIIDALTLVKATTTRGITKDRFIERLEGKFVEQKNVPPLTTVATKKKESYRKQWLLEIIPGVIKDVNYCVEAIYYLSNQEIIEHQQYICLTLLRIFNNDYEVAPSIVAFNIRKAICRIDEALYLDG